MDRESMIYKLNRMNDHELINVVLSLGQYQMEELINKDAEITRLQEIEKLLERKAALLKRKIEIMELVNQEEPITRIADSLESLNNNLSDIAVSLESIDKNLSACISHYGNNSFLCITGNVSTN